MFRGAPQARYLVALLALGRQCDQVGDVPGIGGNKLDVLEPEAFVAATRLRYAVYHDRYHWIESDRRDSDGGERLDADDHRAAHFGVIKNIPGELPRMIGYDRLILKDVDGKPLPVEHHFPEQFSHKKPNGGSTEMSRVISESANRLERNLATLAFYRANIGWGTGNGYKYGLGMTEPYLFNLLKEAGIPHKQLSEFVPVEDYGGSKNALLYVDPFEIIKQMDVARGTLRFARGLLKERKPRYTSLVAPLFFNQVDENQGLGFFGRYFLRRHDT